MANNIKDQSIIPTANGKGICITGYPYYYFHFKLKKVAKTGSHTISLNGKTKVREIKRFIDGNGVVYTIDKVLNPLNECKFE